LSQKLVYILNALSDNNDEEETKKQQPDNLRGRPNDDYDDDLVTLLLMMLPLSSTPRTHSQNPFPLPEKPTVGKQIWYQLDGMKGEIGKTLKLKKVSVVVRTTKTTVVKIKSRALAHSLCIYLSLFL